MRIKHNKSTLSRMVAVDSFGILIFLSAPVPWVFAYLVATTMPGLGAPSVPWLGHRQMHAHFIPM